MRHENDGIKSLSFHAEPLGIAGAALLFSSSLIRAEIAIEQLTTSVHQLASTIQKVAGIQEITARISSLSNVQAAGHPLSEREATSDGILISDRQADREERLMTKAYNREVRLKK